MFLAPIISFKPYQVNTYWSRTSFQFGERAVRFLTRPAGSAKMVATRGQLSGVLRALAQGGPEKEDYLRAKLREALEEEDVCFEFCVQLFVDETRTPVEHAFIEWKESDSPPVPIGTLIIPRQGLDPELQEGVERMAFNPWNTMDFTPLGSINLARKQVYDASASHRGADVRTRDQ